MTEHEFKMGDEVVAWDDDAVTKVRGKFISYVQGEYPFYVLLEDGRVEIFKYCKPYKAPAKRPMTHKEVFELRARESVVFMNTQFGNHGRGNKWILCHWDNSKDVTDYEYCPVAELVEPLDKSPWRKLELEG